MKKLLSIALAVVMLLSLVACGGGGEEATEEGLYEGAPAGLAERDTPVKVAVIRNLGADEHTAQFLAGTIEEGTSLGFIVDTFTTNGATTPNLKIPSIKFSSAATTALSYPTGRITLRR